MHENLRLRSKSVVRLLQTTGKVTGIVLVLDVIGISIFQLYHGKWSLLTLLYALPWILMIEGAVVGVIGSLMYIGYSEYRLMGQAAINPQIARESSRGWDKRRLSQREFGIVIMVVGLVLFLAGFLLASFLGI